MTAALGFDKILAVIFDTFTVELTDSSEPLEPELSSSESLLSSELESSLDESELS